MKFKPHRYQKYCIDRVLAEPALALWLDMGLGKSVITLTAVNTLKYDRFEISKCLIIAPKKVAEATWNREAEKWDHLQLLRVANVLGTEKQRLAALKENADVYVINRENVTWLVEQYGPAWPFDMVVIDEASSFKNHAAKRTKALASVRAYMDRIVELTGTPAPNGPMDLWAQIWLLDRGERLERRISHFREKYFNSIGGGQMGFVKYYPKKGAEDVIQQRIADICISMSAEDYLELPPLTTNVVPVKLSPKAQRDYNRLERDMLLEVAGEIVDVTSAAALSNKLCQLCNGAIYDEDRNVHQIHNDKLDAFGEIIDSLQGQPAIVFYSYQHDLPRIENMLAKMKKPDGTRYRVQRLDGKDQEMAWNNREIDILLAHPASAAYGLNLQDGGNHVIWYGLSWSLELYQQANARLHRQGQKERVIIHILTVEGGRDEDVMAALSSKNSAQADLLDSLKARIDGAKTGGPKA